MEPKCHISFFFHFSLLLGQKLRRSFCHGVQSIRWKKCFPSLKWTGVPDPQILQNWTKKTSEIRLSISFYLKYFRGLTLSLPFKAMHSSLIWLWKQRDQDIQRPWRSFNWLCMICKKNNLAIQDKCTMQWETQGSKLLGEVLQNSQLITCSMFWDIELLA